MVTVTVTQLNKYLGSIFRSDRNLSEIMVKGEITNLSPFTREGKTYLFFSLKDSDSVIGAVMFSDTLRRMKFMPEDGMSVVVSGKVTVYEPRGTYRITVNDLIPEGAGKAVTALDQLKKKLASEGIFDTAHKRQVPAMPKKVGVVTSLRGAAVRDVINVISRRFPLAEVYAVNAQVQGEGAVDSICRGIVKAENSGCDVVIVGRGGGSSEDLGAFDTEKVAYAVYNCKVPVISAVGHETDISVCDLAADLRAPTPSAAAELAVPDISQLYDRISQLEKRAESCVKLTYSRSAERYRTLNASLSAQSPENRLKIANEMLSGIENRMENAFGRYFERLDSVLSERIGRLESLSPLKVLSRGYSLTYRGNELVKSSDELSVGENVELRFNSGRAEAEIKNIW